MKSLGKADFCGQGGGTVAWAGPAEGWAAGVFVCNGAKMALGADSRIGTT